MLREDGKINWGLREKWVRVLPRLRSDQGGSSVRDAEREGVHVALSGLAEAISTTSGSWVRKH